LPKTKKKWDFAGEIVTSIGFESYQWHFWDPKSWDFRETGLRKSVLQTLKNKIFQNSIWRFHQFNIVLGKNLFT
jgi:hypothetical protein